MCGKQAAKWGAGQLNVTYIRSRKPQISHIILHKTRSDRKEALPASLRTVLGHKHARKALTNPPNLDGKIVERLVEMVAKTGHFC